MSNKTEIIQIHIGQAGVQIANACWELYCLEHGINASGYLVHPPVDDSFLTFFNCSSTQCKVVPRLVMIDTEPTVIDEIRVGAYRNLFHPDTLISGKDDTGSNFARGYNLCSAELMECAMNAVRQVASRCQNLRGFLLFHAIGGGTGSGFCARLLEELACCYGRKIVVVDFVLFPSPSLSSVIVEPYNAVLATHLSSENSDVTFIVDNEALYDICATKLGVSAPTYTNLNRIIGQVVSAFTASQRFSGITNVSFNEFQTNLVPYPRVRYPLMTYSPLTPINRGQYDNLTVEQMTNECFCPNNLMVRCDPLRGRYMAAVLLYRGNVSGTEVNAALQGLRNSPNVRFTDWAPTGYKVGINGMPPSFVPCGDLAPTSRALCAITNNTAIITPWCRLLNKFDSLYKKRAFVYHYVGEGMEECTLNDAAEFVCEIIKEYDAVNDIRGDDAICGSSNRATSTGSITSSDRPRTSTNKQRTHH